MMLMIVPELRARGIGTYLLEVIEFLNRSGAKPLVDQLEMTRAL